MKAIMTRTNFQLVAAMNEAFGNPQGNYMDFHYPEVLGRVRSQTWNIMDEFGEALTALGYPKETVVASLNAAKGFIQEVGFDDTKVKVKGFRDALCDINVFSYGAHHIAGFNADEDMVAVITGVMSRFIKSDTDKAETILRHAHKGVTDVYFEGDYPVMVMKSAKDQPDAPKGKFLKSASYREPVFVDVPWKEYQRRQVQMDVEDSDDMLREFAREVWLADGKLKGEPKHKSDHRVLGAWSKTFGGFRDDKLQGQYAMFKAALRIAGILK